MENQQRVIEDVGMANLQFPIRVLSGRNAQGQDTVASITVNARILQEFEARWIDRFIQVLHRHRGIVGATALQDQALDYLHELDARSVSVEYEFPYFIEKTTPASGEKCLVRYRCAYAVRVHTLNNEPTVLFRIEVPCITTYPGSSREKPGGLFGQLSRIGLEVMTRRDIYPEDLVDMVDRHALAPLYSYLTEEDQMHVIERVHTEEKNSVVVVDAIKLELARRRDIEWYAVKSANYGMLHSYSTMVGLEKSPWIPFSGYESGDI
ncbi:MAG: GTP cyclohydrolase, FolE2/MptA family [Pedobacter sp.]